MQGEKGVVECAYVEGDGNMPASSLSRCCWVNGGEERSLLAN
jgi:hypothetical protein